MDSQRYAKVKDIFNLCTVPKDAGEMQALIEEMSDSIGTMAMVNYPYETNFLNPLPAWPQKEGCKAAKTAAKDMDAEVS